MFVSLYKIVRKFRAVKLLRQILNMRIEKRLLYDYAILYLKERGYFLENSTAAVKSDVISAQTKAGSEQSGLAGHHSLCFLDCRIPLGSRTSRTKRIPRL